MRVLVAEDNADLRDFLRRALTEEGIAVDDVADGESAFHQVRTVVYDAAILDWMMPRRSGLQVVKDLRANGNRTPLLILTARDTVDDVVSGLNSGADDYLTKPFKFAILLARLYALARRQGGEGSSVLAFNHLTLDLATHQTAWNGKPIPLQPKDEAILAYLMRSPNRPLSRTQIYENVWNDAYDGISNTLEVHIKEIRRALEIAGAPRLIHTLRGRGYMLALEQSE